MDENFKDVLNKIFCEDFQKMLIEHFEKCETCRSGLKNAVDMLKDSIPFFGMLFDKFKGKLK